MKPRIVRELGVGQGFPFALHEVGVGPAYLGLPWPKVGTGPGECPYTPEQVMAACERKGLEVLGRVYSLFGESWWMWVQRGTHAELISLTPEFIGEPKCNAPGHEWTPPENCYSVCPRCNAILSDRRYYTQRKEERRKIGKLYSGGRRRINTSLVERRTGTDRRRS